MTNKKHYRLYVINKIPQIRVLDFQKVKLKVSHDKLKISFEHNYCAIVSSMELYSVCSHD